jgi:UDP-glucose 4-epimerase
MVILITGGCGYIGSHVVRKLSEQGADVLVLDNLSTGSKESLLFDEKLLQVDLADLESLNKVFETNNINSVIHFAASIIVPESLENPIKYYSNNSNNTLNLLNSCVKYGVKNFVFSSTGAVYGMLQSDFAVEDETLTQPINPYGSSKLVSEWMIKDVAKAQNLNYVILRYFNVAGSDPKMRIGQRNTKAAHLIKVCCEAALGKRNFVEIFGTDYQTIDGTCIRDYIHVEDLADAHLKSLDYLNKKGESQIFNMGYGQGNSVREVIKIAQQISGVNFEILESPRREGDPVSVVANVDKALKFLDWKPKYNNLEQIITDSLNWEKKLLSFSN